MEQFQKAVTNDVVLSIVAGRILMFNLEDSCSLLKTRMRWNMKRYAGADSKCFRFSTYSMHYMTSHYCTSGRGTGLVNEFKINNSVPKDNGQNSSNS